MKILEKLKNISPAKIKKGCMETVESVQASKKAFLLVVLLTLVLMFAVCWIVFFATVRGPEQVMVPNVEGKELTTALLEMQAKELYPKIQLKYTDNPDDAGKILNQSPEAGSIVKAGRRINLTVSRGVIMDKVANYIGQKYDDVKISLQTMFTGSSRPLVVLSDPSYKADKSEAGTILAQDPPEGTIISDPVTVKLIVSRGPEYENTKVPNITGLDFEKLIKMLPTAKVVFDFTAHVASENEKEGVVSSQQVLDSEYLPNYSRVTAEVALPKKQDEDRVLGLFTTDLPLYPYAVELTLEKSLDGLKEPLLTLRHTGGHVTIPYIAEKESVLILSVAGRTLARQAVE